jgi:hypothetical protein
MVPTEKSLFSQVCSFASPVPTTSGGGPAARAALP